MSQANASGDGNQVVDVVAALSLSVLPGPDSGFDHPAERQQFLSWLSNRDNQRRVAAWVAEHRPDAPSSELTPLPAILDRLPPSSRIRLQLLVDSDDPLHGPVVGVLCQVVDLIEATQHRVEVVEVAVAAGFTSMEGAGVAGISVPDALAPLVASGGEVWVNATSSVRAVSIQAVALAGVAGWNVFIVPDRNKAEIHVLDLRAIGPDRAAVMAVLDDDDLSTVLDQLDDSDAVGDTQTSGGAPRRMGPSLRSYYETLVAELPDRPAHPGTAAVLERHGRSGRVGATESARLAEVMANCVQAWVDQRLWSLNLIPEIVVHDDRHVERVDGFLALLAAPLLHGGVVAPGEVAAMSAAAWLHDWGHVGSRLGRGYVSHPIAVRYLHGLLSRQLIADSPRTHGLSVLGGGMPDLVGVLCAHHQRWCSCSGARVDPAGKQFELLQIYTDAPEALAPPLHEEADRLDIDAERLELMVALLRVADACDVGAHRAPTHGRRRQEFLSNCAQRELDRTAALLHQLAGRTEHMPTLLDWVDQLRRVVGDMWDQSGGHGQLVLPATPNLDGASAEVRATVQLSEAYLDVLADRSHDDLHRSIQLVRFRVDLATSGDVVVHPVIWLASDPTDGGDAFLGMMQSAIDNELECITSAGTVRDTVSSAGLTIDDVTIGSPQF
jgi:hypothetical protein